jgi:2-alkyl-3-oxoalkanoate reductase
MRILIAGASGAIGKRLVPMLVNAGHAVIATTRTRDKLDGLRATGADAVILDGLDADGVMKTVTELRPEAVVHQMTALTSMRDLKHWDDEFAMTNRLRTEGTRYLLAAAHAAGARQFVAQSYAGWPSGREPGPVTTESDPLDSNPAPAMSKTLEAIKSLEPMVTNAVGLIGTVLRYGSLYGPGTSISDTGEIVQLIRRRRFPLIGSGAGVWSFIHVDDAARATQLALERHASGIFNIVDDQPVEVSLWLPGMAQIIGAKPPMHLPRWVGRLLLGSAGVALMTEGRGASNAKAKRVLGWKPAYPTWREGFAHGLAANLPAVAYPRAV